MLQNHLSKEELARQAEALYDREIRAKVEVDASNIGKIIVIDVESGDFEIDKESIAASKRLQARHPNGHRYAMRIGYDAVYSFGGPLTRTKP